MSVPAAIEAMSPVRIIVAALTATIAAAAKRPTGSSRLLVATLPRALNGAGAGRVRRRRASAATVSTSITASAIPYARASQAMRPPLASTTRIVAATVTSIARAGVPNLVCSEREARGQRAVGGVAMEHLLGVAERRMRGRDEQQHGGAGQSDRHQRRGPRQARRDAAPDRPAAHSARASPRPPARAGRRERRRMRSPPRQRTPRAGRCA